MKHYFLILAFALSTTSCRAVNWPGLVSCGVHAVPTLVEETAKALEEGRGVHACMVSLAKTYGSELVVCAVRSLVIDVRGMHAGREARREARPEEGPLLSPEAKERGRRFLHEIGHD